MCIIYNVKLFPNEFSITKHIWIINYRNKLRYKYICNIAFHITPWFKTHFASYGFPRRQSGHVEDNFKVAFAHQQEKI